MRWVFGASLLAILGMVLPEPASAEPQLLCRRPEVLRIVARSLRNYDVYLRLDERTVQEFPGGSFNQVQCTLLVSTTTYEALASGAVLPRRAVLISRYSVRVEGHRVMVEVPPPG